MRPEQEPDAHTCRVVHLPAEQAALLDLVADVWLSCHVEARLVEAQDDAEISSLPSKRAKVLPRAHLLAGPATGAAAVALLPPGHICRQRQLGAGPAAFRGPG